MEGTSPWIPGAVLDEAPLLTSDEEVKGDWKENVEKGSGKGEGLSNPNPNEKD